MLTPNLQSNLKLERVYVSRSLIECHLLIGNIWTSVYCYLHIVKERLQLFRCSLSGLLLDLLLTRHL
jgi:hypothetical protein